MEEKAEEKKIEKRIRKNEGIFIGLYSILRYDTSEHAVDKYNVLHGFYQTYNKSSKFYRNSLEMLLQDAICTDAISIPGSMLEMNNLYQYINVMFGLLGLILIWNLHNLICSYFYYVYIGNTCVGWSYGSSCAIAGILK